MTTPISTSNGPMSAPRGARVITETDIAIRVAIVVLALATGVIHATLGGPLFALNAAGYFVAAVAMVIPLGIAIRHRWLIRLGLIGYAAMTIVGWLLVGPRYDVAYLAKVIEVALIALLAIEFVRYDGSPSAVLRRTLADARHAIPKGGH